MWLRLNNGWMHALIPICRCVCRWILWVGGHCVLLNVLFSCHVLQCFFFHCTLIVSPHLHSHHLHTQHLPEQYLGAVDLLRKLLKADPAQRASAADVLAHPWVASAAPVLSAKPMSIRTRGSPTTPLDASSEDAIAESPDSCASITSNVASFSSSTPTEHAERGLRNWWAPQPPWPPAMRATMARPPRPDRVPSYVVLPACMSAHIPQIDVRMPVPDPPQHAA